MKLIVPSLVPRYQEPHRKYHTLQHIGEMFATYIQEFSCFPPLDRWEYRNLFDDIWYHDAIYDPKRKDNEYQSAQLAVSENRFRNMDAVFLDVMTTTHHRTERLVAQVLADLDLAILSSPPLRYREYADQIREEYSFVPLQAYLNGRIAVLRRFLQQEKLYYFLPLDREEMARMNISIEIGVLQMEGGK